jgi:hypothetical protein
MRNDVVRYSRACRLLEDVSMSSDEEERAQKRQLNKLYLNLVKFCLQEK